LEREENWKEMITIIDGTIHMLFPSRLVIPLQKKKTKPVFNKATTHIWSQRGADIML